MKDGYLNIAAGGQHMWKRVCTALNASELLDDPRFATPGKRSRNRNELTVALEEKLQTKTAAEWVEILNTAGVPSGPILTIDQVFANEQVQHLGIATPIEHPQLGLIRILGLPTTLSRTPGAVQTAAPEKGEHTEEILHEIGFSTSDIQQLRTDGLLNNTGG